MRDYVKWHDDYADPSSNNSARLRRVQGLIADELASRPGPIRLLSLCSGDARDILGVLADRPADVPRVTGRIVELSEPLAAMARNRVAELGAGIEVVEGDAGDPRNCLGAIPADLVLLVGIMGNISEDDVLYLAATAASLCAPGARVIYSRGNADTELIARIGARMAEAGFVDGQFFTEPPHRYGLGIARWPDREPPALPLERKLFTFVR